MVDKLNTLDDTLRYVSLFYTALVAQSLAFVVGVYTHLMVLSIPAIRKRIRDKEAGHARFSSWVSEENVAFTRIPLAVQSH